MNALCSCISLWTILKTIKIASYCFKLFSPLLFTVEQCRFQASPLSKIDDSLRLIIFDEQRKVPALDRVIYYGCENQYSALYILDRDKVTE